MCLGTEDGVAEYYQQQVEMLAGFNEMDALADRGFLPRMSKVHMYCIFLFQSLATIMVVKVGL